MLLILRSHQSDCLHNVTARVPNPVEPRTHKIILHTSPLNAGHYCRNLICGMLFRVSNVYCYEIQILTLHL